MSDTAKGPLAGYLFQFEKALLLLSELDNPNDFLTIEDVDDIAVHNSTDESIILTIQAKHSILPTGTTFQDTSYALWRTFQIWIEKLNEGIFDTSTKFICSTNKAISSETLLYKIKTKTFDEAIELITELLKVEEIKLKEKIITDIGSGIHIKKIIRLIKFVLKNQDSFKVVKDNLDIHDNEKIQERFFNRLNLNSTKITTVQKDKIYQEFYGWIIGRSKAKWNNSSSASFSKKEFDEKYFQINSNPAIINAIFRAKKDLDSLDLTREDIIGKMKTELYVKQIEDIERGIESKERIIKNAIIDFIYHDNELRYIIEQGDYTQTDFDSFIQQCFETWQEIFDSIVLYEATSYSEEEKNRLAIVVFDKIMLNLEISFKEGFNFNISNRYFKNGCFLKLSNSPEIGWHPEWGEKYKNYNGAN